MKTETKEDVPTFVPTMAPESELVPATPTQSLWRAARPCVSACLDSQKWMAFAKVIFFTSSEKNKNSKKIQSLFTFFNKYIAVDPCKDGEDGGCSDICNFKGPGVRTCSCNANAKFVDGSTETICECFPGFDVDATEGTCEGKKYFKFFHIWCFQ